MTTIGVEGSSSRRGSSALSGRGLATTVLAAALVMLWLWPPGGVVACVAAGTALAPWGRGIGERVIISCVLGTAAISAVMVLLSATNSVIPPIGWRVMLSAVVLGEIACLYVRRSAPTLPRLQVDDAIGLVAGLVFFLVLFGVYATATTAHTITGLLQWWAGGELPHDHSSHLPMFLQMMRSGGWAGTASPDLLFAGYPRLHVAVWSAGEWAAGLGAGTPAVDLVRPYVAWSALTAALAAAVLTWSASIAARALMPRRTGSRTRSVAAGIAGTTTALWCLLGSMGSMFDFAAASFLACAALVVGAVTVSVRSRAAMTRLGWFVLPLAGVVAAYVYLPLAAGLLLPALAVGVALWRWRRRRLVWFVVVGLVCAALAAPALTAITDSVRNAPWGALTGGLPAFEYWPAVVMAAVATLTLALSSRAAGRLVSLALLGPVLSACAVTLYFLVDSVRAGVTIGDSYYTNKMVYALLLAAVPLTAAVVARWTSLRLAKVPPARQGTGLVIALVVIVIAVAEISTVTLRPGVGGGVLTRPAGLAAFEARQSAVTRIPLVGDVVLSAAAHPDSDGHTTVTWIPVARSVTGYRSEYVNMFAGRLAHSLAIGSDIAYERYNVTVDTILRTADPVASLGEVLQAAPDLRLTLVVPDQQVADSLAGVVAKFGPERLRLVIADRSD